MASYINPNIHYYGWYRIQEAIQKIDTPLKIIDFADIYFLNYNATVIEEPWIGIIHHTSCSFSCNNIISLFKNNIFLHSLKFCKQLISLSQTNKFNILTELNKIYFSIPIAVLKHPMPPNYELQTFDMKHFEDNLEVFNIGGWLRNPYTIYHSSFYYEGKLLNKNKVKGHAMDQYFPNDSLDLTAIVQKIVSNKVLIEKETSNIDDIFEYSHPYNSSNYYTKYLIEYIKNLIEQYKSTNKSYTDTDILNTLISNHNSVNIVNYLKNPDYLNVLTRAIIFCDYIDCSASNTIMECISTATPIILNRLPATIEYLGYNYALYSENIYDSETDTFTLTRDQVLLAHKQLLELRKDFSITLDHFIYNLTIIANNIQVPIIRKKKYFYYF